MSRLKHIILLAKKAALSILNNQEIKELDAVFKNDNDEIIERLQKINKNRHKSGKFDALKASKNEDWKKIQKQIAKKPFLKNTDYLKIAAVFTGLIAISYFLTSTLNNQSSIVNNSIASNNSQIILKLENGSTKVINNENNHLIFSKSGKIIGQQKGNTLNYSESNNITNIEYNELTVPYGKTFKLILSDETTIHLNAGTHIKYPVKFIPGKNRTVYMTGEAFFNVTKNKDRPFVVKSNELDITVLGTQFNVTAYPENANINTVLVEGSVSLNSETNKKPTFLTPQHKAIWNPKLNTIKIKKVSNTYMYTSWMDGKITFKHLKFKHIIKRLERHYNVSIKNLNQELAEQTFTAAFDSETIDQVLKSFDHNFKMEYIIKNNNITIY